VRRLAQPKVVLSSLLAAAATALLCLPRLVLWGDRKFPVWYGEATVFFSGFVLWAFVFAWHTEYSRRPIFTWRVGQFNLAVVTALGIWSATVAHFFFDSWLRPVIPQEYPADLRGWLASTLFTLSFTQLFLVFAPFAWAMRLFRNQKVAIILTAAFGVGVWLLKINASPQPLPTWLFVELFLSRIVQATLAVWFYLRGGMLLVLWPVLLFESRHLIDLL
jgi:hypothetical protein